MKMKVAMEIIDTYEEHKNRQPGYMVEFEHRKHSILASGHFPDANKGDELIPTETKAWDLANRFNEATNSDYVNIYVIDQNYRPVANHANKTLNRYPPRT